MARGSYLDNDGNLVYEDETTDNNNPSPPANSGQTPAPGSGNAGREYSAAEKDWLARNPGDAGRMDEALSNYTGDRLYDSQDTSKYDTHGKYIGGAVGKQASGSPVTSNGRIAPPPYKPGPAPTAYKAGQVATPQTYQPSTQFGAINTPAAYTAGQLKQYAPVDQAQTNQLQMDLINAILANPHTLNPEAVAQLKEKQKDSALAFSGQNRESALRGADFAGRGVNGGMRNALDMEIASALDSNLLGAYRDVDLAALATNRSDELAALQMSGDVTGGQVSRAGAQYASGLSGEMSQEELKQAAVSSALSAAGFDLNKAAATADDKFRANAAEQQQWQALLDDLYRQSESERNIYGMTEDNAYRAAGGGALQGYQAENSVRQTDDALAQAKWQALLDEAYRRDEQNRQDRLAWAGKL